MAVKFDRSAKSMVAQRLSAAGATVDVWEPDPEDVWGPQVPFQLDFAGTKVEVVAQPGDPMLLLVTAWSGEGDLTLKRTVVARVQAGATTGPKVLGISRLSDEKPR